MAPHARRPLAEKAAKDALQTHSTTSWSSEVTPQTPSTIAHCSALGYFGFQKKLGQLRWPDFVGKQSFPARRLCRLPFVVSYVVPGGL